MESNKSSVVDAKEEHINYQAYITWEESNFAVCLTKYLVY